MADVHVTAHAAARNNARDPLSPTPQSSTAQYAQLVTRLLWCLALERALSARDGADPRIDAAIRAAERAWSGCHRAACEMIDRPCARPEDLLAVRAAAVVRDLVEARDTPDAGRRYQALSETLARIACTAGDAPRGIARLISTTKRCLMTASDLDGAPLFLPMDLPPMEMDTEVVAADGLPLVAADGLPPVAVVAPDAPAL